MNQEELEGLVASGVLTYGPLARLHQYVAGVISLRDLERRVEIIMKGREAK